jgi:ubiquinone/menaquinone biosynthesis C-methylase UbiE
MENKNSIEEIVIGEFSTKGVQDTYKDMTREGVWISEELLFRKYFKKGSKILDIGCGSGRTTFDLIKLKYKVIAVDLTPAMIKSAKELSKEFKIKADFREGDATKLEFKENSFDYALFSFNGWNQIPGKENRQKAIEEAYRVIKPEGYFIFTSHLRKFGKWTPFWIKQWIKMYVLKPFGYQMREKEYGDRFFRRASRETYENDQYIHLPRLSEVEQQIKKAGFILEYKEYRNIIAPEDSKMKSANCMFFVCKKPSY